MTIALIVLAVVILVNYVLEAGIAPSERLQLRFRLFALRDRLRDLKMQNPELSDEVFDLVQDELNCGIYLLPLISATLMAKAKNGIANDESWRSRIKKRRHLLETCGNDEVRRIDAESTEVLRDALAINSIGWMIYILPPIIAWILVRVCLSSIRSLLSTPLKELERRFPNYTDVAIASN